MNTGPMGFPELFPHSAPQQYEESTFLRRNGTLAQPFPNEPRPGLDEEGFERWLRTQLDRLMTHAVITNTPSRISGYGLEIGISIDTRHWNLEFATENRFSYLVTLSSDEARQIIGDPLSVAQSWAQNELRAQVRTYLREAYAHCDPRSPRYAPPAPTLRPARVERRELPDFNWTRPDVRPNDFETWPDSNFIAETTAELERRILREIDLDFLGRQDTPETRAQMAARIPYGSTVTINPLTAQATTIRGTGASTVASNQSGTYGFDYRTLMGTARQMGKTETKRTITDWLEEHSTGTPKEPPAPRQLDLFD